MKDRNTKPELVDDVGAAGRKDEVGRGEAEVYAELGHGVDDVDLLERADEAVGDEAAAVPLLEDRVEAEHQEAVGDAAGEEDALVPPGCLDPFSFSRASSICAITTRTRGSSRLPLVVWYFATTFAASAASRS